MSQSQNKQIDKLVAIILDKYRQGQKSFTNRQLSQHYNLLTDIQSNLIQIGYVFNFNLRHKTKLSDMVNHMIDGHYLFTIDVKREGSHSLQNNNLYTFVCDDVSHDLYHRINVN